MEAKMQRLLKNYRNARISWEAWCFMSDIGMKVSSRAVREKAGQNPLLFHLRYLALKDLHIELYKIIKDKKSTCKDNVFDLLRSQEQNKNIIETQLAKLNDFKTEIDSLTDCRDKFYAHLDSDFQEYLTSFKIDDYYKCFELIEESILILGYKSDLLAVLKDIPSRDEFELS